MPLGASLTRSTFIIFLSAAALSAEPSGIFASTATFKPVVIESDAQEIPNPGRGFFRWISKETAPILCPDRYARYNWSALEKAKGQYNFSVIEKEADAAKAAGGTFGFGVRNVVGGIALACPEDVKTTVPGWFSEKQKCWVPDWNSEVFLSRIETFISALGAKYGKDPRIGYIEIRTYGNWGEWHLSRFEDPPAPIKTISNNTVHRIIDAWVRAFPHKQLIMMSDHGEGLRYAMSLTNLEHPIGWRRDSWCNPHFRTLKKALGWEMAKDRWKSAPVTVESYGGKGHTSALGLDQILDYHVSAIGNGNFGVEWKDLSTEDQLALIRCAKAAGYRYVLRSLVVDGAKDLLFTARWANVGVAPIYTDWNVVYRLKEAKSGAVAWEGISKLKLRSILPTFDRKTGVDTTVEVTDTFLRPVRLADGVYQVDMRVVDPSGYHVKPLNLAIQGRDAEGAYQLGTVEIKADLPKPVK